MIPEQKQHKRIVASIESPPEGVSGVIKTSSAIEVQPCRQAKKVTGKVGRQRRSLLADIEANQYRHARVLWPIRCTVNAETFAVNSSVVRVRMSMQTDYTTADVSENAANYYLEYDTNCIEAKVDLYWRPVARKRQGIEATQYELAQPTTVLMQQLQELALSLRDNRKPSASYLIDRRIETIKVVATAACRTVSRDRYTYDELMAKVNPTAVGLRSFLQECLAGKATKVSLTLGSEELVK